MVSVPSVFDVCRLGAIVSAILAIPASYLGLYDVTIALWVTTCVFVVLSYASYES